MGMNHEGEIRLLTNIAKPDICIITNIGTSHIGNLGSRENILKAKLEILEGNENSTIIINNDNDLLHKWYEDNKQKKEIYTYGIKEKSDLNAKNISLCENYSEFKCDINGKECDIKVPVGGEHFVLNSLCATLVGKVLDIPVEDIVFGIEGFELTKKRMDIVEINDIKVINDAYNASLESMKASLEYLSKVDSSRKIAVLGDMFELGEYSEELHRKVGVEVYKNKIDILICSGENARYIIEQAKTEGMKEGSIYYFDNKDKIIEQLKGILKPGDVVLFKASNGMRFFDIAEKVKNII